MNKVEDDKGPILISARNARNIVKITCAIVGVIVGYLQLKNLPFAQIVNNMSAELILKSSFILYYFSWLFGAPNDANDQELILIHPKKLSADFIMFLIIGFLATAFIFLCLANSFNARILFFIAVIVLDWISSFYYKFKFINSAFKYSEEEFKKNDNIVTLMKLFAVKKYLYGKWIKIRFILGLAYLILLSLIIFTPISNYIGNLVSNLSLDVLLSIAFLFFVLLYEGVVWVKRFEVKVKFRTIEDILEKYQKMLPKK
jgi:hypothetical protein